MSAAPPPGAVIPGDEVRGERTVRADACVIGTGAGGAPAAKELAEGGMRVVMLEDGLHFTTDHFTARPREMAATLYRDAGQTATVGNVPILLPLGRAVGGTTVVNSGTCFRAPDRVLEQWRERFGLEGMSGGELNPFFATVERELHVAKVPPELAGRNALVVKRGADALGWSGDFIRRNAKGCVGSGVCAFGCPTSAKQHTALTFLPGAWKAGAVTYSGCRARRIDPRPRPGRGLHRPHVVQARTAGGGTVRVECEHVVMACGAIHTPLLLARSGLGRRSGQLGSNLAIHPATAVRALFDEVIDMAVGVPQSYFIDEFSADGLMFEGAAGPPDYLASSFPYSRERHRDVMLRYRHLSQFGVMVSDRSRGSVRRRLGRVEIHYDVGPDDLASIRRGILLLTELYWAAGAREVYQPLDGTPPLRDGEAGPLARRALSPQELTLMAFHPMGTARAHADPRRGVVDPDLQLHGVPGVHVADASAVPSSLGVNPQVTIMALATRLAFHLLGKPPPGIR